MLSIFLLASALAAPEDASMVDKCNRRLITFKPLHYLLTKSSEKTCKCPDVPYENRKHYEAMWAHSQLIYNTSVVACQQNYELCLTSSKPSYPQFQPITSVKVFCDSGDKFMKEELEKLPYEHTVTVNEMVAIPMKFEHWEACDALFKLKCRGGSGGGSSGESSGSGNSTVIEGPQPAPEKNEKKNLH